MKLIWHTNPDQAVAKKCRELEEARKENGEAYYWALTREVLRTDPWFMMRVALEWAWLDEDLVGHHFIKHVAENWGTDLSELFPRGHGKTLPMSAIVCSSVIDNPNGAILQISRTEDNANKFGALVSEHWLNNDYLQRCFGTKYNKGKDAIFPASAAECKAWGLDGYYLPNRKPRLDPTLLCISSTAAKAGKHPDWIYLDDLTEEENNNPKEWEKTEKIVNGCKLLLPADGFFNWTATRWHDGDPMGKVENGTLKGKQDAFKVIKFSCYQDDDPSKPPTYPRKVRWNMNKATGYTHAALENMRAPKEEGGLGEFFDAQMRNDPAPLERADIKVRDINIYEEINTPKTDVCRLMGIETTGGGLIIYNGFIDHLDSLKINIPLTRVSCVKTPGVSKRDRIVAAIQPIVDRGGLYVQDWMIGDEGATEGLGYELRRLGKANHDDTADCLHIIITQMVNGVIPPKDTNKMDLYIGVDLAWSEEKRADWTVAMAVAVDSKANYWVLDYDRFQISSPTGLYTRLLAFYQKFDSPSALRKRTGNRKRFMGAWR